MLAKEETANTLFQSLKIENENRMLVKIDSATYWNESLIDPKDYEAMERTINEIFLNTIAIGEFTPLVGVITNKPSVSVFSPSSLRLLPFVKLRLTCTYLCFQ